MNHEDTFKKNYKKLPWLGRFFYKSMAINYWIKQEKNDCVWCMRANWWHPFIWITVISIILISVVLGVWEALLAIKSLSTTNIQPIEND